MKHQIFLQRYGGGWWAANKDVITELSKEIEVRIMMADVVSSRKLDKLYADLDALLVDKIDIIRADIKAKTPELSAYEAGFTERMMLNAVKPGIVFEGLQTNYFDTFFENQLAQLVSGKKIKTQTLDEIFDTFTGTAQTDVRDKIRAGIALGDTNEDIAKTVSKMVDSRTKRQAETVVRTAANHVGGQTRQSFYGENDDVLEGYIYSATLDSNTTILCAGLDGKHLPLDTDTVPPLHYNCRSALIPDVKDEFKIFKDGGKRASQFGPVSGKITYSGFLRNQSKEFQDQVLGPKRAKLFRSGKLTLTKFVDDDGVLLTLKELEALEGITIN
jgi:SPP1 gp7 family putative phage head morphogenesis protein